VADSYALLKAVRLLDEVIELVNNQQISTGSRGSAKAVLVKLRGAKRTLLTELEQPKPSSARVAALVFNVVKWLGELLTNIQYKDRPRQRGLDVPGIAKLKTTIKYGYRTVAQVLSASLGAETEGFGPKSGHFSVLPVAG